MIRGIPKILPSERQPVGCAYGWPAPGISVLLGRILGILVGGIRVVVVFAAAAETAEEGRFVELVFQLAGNNRVIDGVVVIRLFGFVVGRLFAGLVFVLIV